jgi:hypothetical protein
MSGRRWRYEFPSDRRDHRGHSVFTTCHRKDERGKPRLAGRFCWTCYVIIREWRLCGRPTQTGRPCMRPAIVIKGAPWPCTAHQGAQWVGRGVRPARRAS